ncbi:MAG: hypothetical protein EBZ49_16470 [Proteobacteria bacterium]|nr:hypothetical protein [Pseudomonadota bacterium]
MSMGMVAMVLTGVTCLQWQSTVWYSAGQTFWAGHFILISLIGAQESLRRGWNWAWPLVCLCCWIAGGFYLGRFFGDEISDLLLKLKEIKLVVTSVIFVLVVVVIVRSLLQYRNTKRKASRKLST